ncbi:MAG: glycosyltransferase family 4 protein [Candidatus Cloacimonetes bacterium]|nr:glycosyltransferase family 4 protein [Candidatus Cloacimonadota bacterium]
MMKLLYIDVPFATIAGGDTNRSSFIWSVLAQNYDADLLLVKPDLYRMKQIPAHDNYRKLFTLGSLKPSPLYPQAIYSFHRRHMDKFREILLKEQYDVIVCRFLSTYHLAVLASEVLPKVKILIDVDMLFSRIAELSWQREKTIRNRYHFLELQKLRLFESKAFMQDFSFFFTNPVERRIAIDRYQLKPERAYVFPNMMPPLAPKDAVKKGDQKYILFFGTLNSIANSDALDFLMQDIYPALKSLLRKHEIKIRIVGKNPLSRQEKYVDDIVQLVGPVQDISKEIAQALFVILPIRVASGTRTRILEAAECGTAVLSTSIGAEGFEFSSDEILIANKAVDFANAINRLVQNPELCSTMGTELKRAATEKYSYANVAKAFLADLAAITNQNKEKTKSRRIALITNRFYPEVGGAETNIYYQAKLLAQQHQLTVFCPKRRPGISDERMDGFRVVRMKDVLNPDPNAPNLKSKTLCPSIVFHLIKGKYDLIQCFPALNYNNILAFWIAKLKRIPYILCFFDFIDYAGEISKHGSIDPDILQSIRPKFYQLPVLRGMDYAFAIAQKEINFLKKYNPRVDYSPVPILSEEYEVPVDKPELRKKWSEDTFVFLSLGRISNIKGQDIALKAFAQAHHKMPGAQFVFVGRTDYEPDFFAGMQSIVEQHGLTDKVHFRGMVDRSEVLGWLHYSDIHVIPVRFMNSGAVVVESWISNTPVIQSDVVDPNLVEEGKNGYLFRRESIDECAEKMILAYNNRAQLPAFAEHGKILVKARYTYSYLIGLYNSVYDLLLRD